MIPLNYLKENKDLVIKKLKIKNFDAESIVDEIISTDEERKSIQQKSDSLKTEANSIAKQIGVLFKEKRIDEANEMKSKSSNLKEEDKQLSDQLKCTEVKLQNLIVQLPNIPHESVPAGKGEGDNEMVSEFGDIPDLSDNALPHWEIAQKYNLIDFELGNKVTGSGFPFYVDRGARLERALINFFLDEAVSAGYKEYIPPLMVNEDSAYATGQLPDKEGQMYHAQTDNFYLIPTAEVPITNIHRGNIYKEEELPIKNVAYSQCFRREAGSYGKDVRGLNRLHQFDKVEIVQVARPEDSYNALEEMLNHVVGLLKKLNLPFRILKLCGGDMSFTSALTYDLEVYSAAQKRWLEVSSVSNFVDFQANRLKLRYKRGSDKPQLAHTLNGSALALPRILAALLENNQTDKGIIIPEVLVKYTGFEIVS